MYYKNIGNFPKTFHGTTFQPGDVKESRDYINDMFMILVDKPKEQSQPKATAPKPAKEAKANKDMKSNAPDENDKGGNSNGTDHDQ